MSGKRLTFSEAAHVIAGADPLVDVRLSMGWLVSNGQRLPVLRISSKSTIDYRAKAKPLGTIYGAAGHPHFTLLLSLSLALKDAVTKPAST